MSEGHICVFTGSARPNRQDMKHILLVEDDDAIAKLVRFKLEKNGFQVTRATNGKEALNWLKENRPALVLLDVMMPEMDGIETLEHIKGDETLRDIPVIMLSSKGQKTEIDRCLFLGAADYIVKPFKPAELVKRIRAVIGET